MQLSHSLVDILSDIQQLVDQDNLASVLIHMNDTYFIDERPPDIPGMARVAGLAKTIRETVFRLLGEDRTLVLHSGDFLSPSAMSRAFSGEPMAELLKSCGVNFATIGNHEFDFDRRVGREILWTRIAAMQCTHVLANLDPPPGRDLTKLAFWPEANPFLAITGLVGKQTVDKALKADFVERDRYEAARQIVENVKKRPGIGALVVLSHMDRAEDKELQRFLSDLWGEHGYLYLLGGHDHNIWYIDRTRPYCYMSKCKSNCKSLTIFLLPKDGIAAPFKDDVNRLFHPNERHEKDLLTEQGDPKESWRTLAALFDWVAAHPGTDIPRNLLGKKNQYPDSALTRDEYRSVASAELRTDFRYAFERRIRSVFKDMSDGVINEAVAHETLAVDVVGWATRFVIDDFQNSSRQMTDQKHLFGLPKDARAEDQVRAWMKKLLETAGDDRLIVDFSSDTAEMDATDDALRRESTDFGNFVADAIKAATGADVALLNSGAFRIDSRLPAKVMLNRLKDVFVYDEPGAVATLMMETEEVLEFYDLAVKKFGHGGFLQVSESRQFIEARVSPLRVAVITHMLKDEEDGFQDILTSSRKVGGNDLLKAVGAKLWPDLIVELVEQGVTKGIAYSRDKRISATLKVKSLEIIKNQFIQLTDSYCVACRDAGIASISDQKHILDGNLHEIPQARITSWHAGRLGTVETRRDELRHFVKAQKLLHPSGDFLIVFQRYLIDDPIRYETDVPYGDYLAAVVYSVT